VYQVQQQVETEQARSVATDGHDDGNRWMQVGPKPAL
jgi:hypothetical protein